MDDNDPGPTSAQTLFDQHLRQVGTHRAQEFQELCAAHPELAGELQTLRAGALALDRMNGRPLAQRLEERLGGARAAMVELEPEPRTDTASPSGLLAQLKQRTDSGNRFRLLGELARGGMGAILRIWDEDLRRVLAMKMALGRGEPSSGDPSAVDARTLGRFVEEAQITGQLDHPGIVPVHNLGLSSDGRVYFTMRLVRGESLSDVFDHVRAGRGGWSVVRVLGVLLKVCEAVAYAHAKGVLHRDLKPANIMVGRFGEVYVMDWGLARVQGREDRHDLRLAHPAGSTLTEVVTDRRELRQADPDSPLVTLDGQILGTPCYMPPEQAKGQLDRLGPGCDVYAIGAMLYELLGGQMPFVPPDARVSPHAILMRLIEGPPRALSELNPAAPAELVAVVEKAMAREPAQRYATVEALANDLRAYTEGRVVGAFEAGAWAEARKWVKRNRTLSLALASSLLIAFGGLTWVSVVQSSAKRTILGQNEALRLSRDTAERRAEDVLALSTSRDLETLLRRADELWPVVPERAEEYQCWLDEARALIEGRPADEARGSKRRPGLADHRAKLEELRARAKPRSEEEIAARRATHPRLADLSQRSLEIQWQRRMLALEPWPEEAAVESALASEDLPADAAGLNQLAWPLVDPAGRSPGAEVRGLLLARRAVAAALPSELAAVRDTLAWALLLSGRVEEARLEAQRLRQEAPPERVAEFSTLAAKLEAAADRWSGDAAIDARREDLVKALRELQQLEGEVDGREAPEFAAPEDAWWFAQLSKLVEDLAALVDPDSGPMSESVTREHGWGIAKRLSFARAIEDLSRSGSEARRRWTDATQAVEGAARYAGLRLEPQLGLLPLGPDPETGFQEFAQLASGRAPPRGANGQLVLDEDTALVFVLLPGGVFLMGAQAQDEGQPRYDPMAGPDEAPVHEVELSPFFVSKYEMTQGQWLRLTGQNPSTYQPGAEISLVRHDLRHPVETVSWFECVQILTRFGLALPTEAQWEYACRAGTDTPWSYGADREQLRGKVNLADATAARLNIPWPGIQDWPDLDDGFAAHGPAGRFAPNPFGLHEMHGNLLEWCLDGNVRGFYRVTPREDPCAPFADVTQRMLRGGDFSGPAYLARVSTRSADAAEGRSSNLGLRPVRRLDPLGGSSPR
jgi:formylglycine-generating enzyme required for sulfatase activity/serine/threonine protein kinase